MMAKWITRYLPAAILLLFTAGCGHDVYYLSAKDRRYDVVPSFTTNKITYSSWVDETDPTTARYTSSRVVARERYKSAVIGNFYVKNRENPAEESLVFSIRKENKTYTAETPIFNSFKIGDKEITPNFSIGHHKAHRIMAGIVFRMPF